MDSIALPIHTIIVDNALQVRDALDRATIDHYADVLDRLPPVVVFDTEDGLLLADGFHRMAAARTLERTHIDAVLHDGSRVDAQDFAASANATAGKPLTRQERVGAVLGFHARHPDWTQRQIADAMSVSQVTVHYLLSVEEVKHVVPLDQILSSGKATTHVKDSHIMQVAAAPQELWGPLVKEAEENKWTVKETQAQVQQVNAVRAAPADAQEPLRQIAKEKQWTPDETKQAAANLTDARIPQAHKDRLLAGEANPVAITPSGEFALMSQTVDREMKQGAKDDSALSLAQARVGLSKLMAFEPAEIVGCMTREDRRYTIDHLPTYITFLEDILHLAQGEGMRLELVK